MKYWHVDAFTSEPFKGNPAAIYIVEKALPEDLMQNIALEHNLSETAFVEIREGKNPFLRWFRPVGEIDLCGHATLASAHVFLTEFNKNLNQVTFDTKVAGPLKVKKEETLYKMQFPSILGEKIPLSSIPTNILNAISDEQPLEAYKTDHLILIYEDENLIYNLAPDGNILKNHKDCIITTAKAKKNFDFVSRFFTFYDGMGEDPVTGSAHCSLAPYWAKTLDKTKLRAYQASKRGGELFLETTKDYVLISGKAVTILYGKLLKDFS